MVRRAGDSCFRASGFAFVHLLRKFAPCGRPAQGAKKRQHARLMRTTNVMLPSASGRRNQFLGAGGFLSLLRSRPAGARPRAQKNASTLFHFERASHTYPGGPSLNERWGPLGSAAVARMMWLLDFFTRCLLILIFATCFFVFVLVFSMLLLFTSAFGG